MSWKRLEYIEQRVLEDEKLLRQKRVEVVFKTFLEEQLMFGG